VALNGSDLINDPFNTTFSPFTGFFERTTGAGMLFFLFPVIVLTLAIYMKTEDPLMATMFMIGSGASLTAGSMFIGSSEMSIVFIIFTAMGIAGMFASLFFGRK